MFKWLKRLRQIIKDNGTVKRLSEENESLKSQNHNYRRMILGMEKLKYV